MCSGESEQRAILCHERVFFPAKGIAVVPFLGTKESISSHHVFTVCHLHVSQRKVGPRSCYCHPHILRHHHHHQFLPFSSYGLHVTVVSYTSYPDTDQQSYEGQTHPVTLCFITYSCLTPWEGFVRVIKHPGDLRG
jgi:hypothetical protein